MRLLFIFSFDSVVTNFNDIHALESCYFPIEGAVVILAGESKLPYGQVPIMLHNGEITLQTSSGNVATLMLDTHNFDEKLQDQSSEQVCARIL